MKKKISIALAAFAFALLLVVGSVAGTFAYLTSTAEVTNTFTVGDIEITMDESKVTEYGVKDGDTRVAENSYKLVPGHIYVKDPVITVAAKSETCYLFIKVTDEIADIQDATTIANQILGNGWSALDGQTGVYYRTHTYSENATAYNTFANFKIKSDADVSAYTGKKIIVTAYAIQTDGFNDDVTAAFNAVVAASTNP